MQDVFIISGARTPVGVLQGALSDVSATELGVIAAKGALERSGVDPLRRTALSLRKKRPQSGGGIGRSENWLLFIAQLLQETAELGCFPISVS